MAVLFVIALACTPILAYAQEQTDEPIEKVSPIKYVFAIGLIVIL